VRVKVKKSSSVYERMFSYVTDMWQHLSRTVPSTTGLCSENECYLQD